MAKGKVAVKKITKEVVSFLSPFIKVNKLILYGSYRYGIPRQDSDLDIAVISTNFEKMSVLEKIELFSKVIVAIDSRIELKGFSLAEYENPEQASFLEMIKKRGKIIYEN